MNRIGNEAYGNLFRNTGVQIFLNDNSFLKVKETLTRIGIASNKNKMLYQSCHILHKRGMYGILHFKELFFLDNKATTIEPSDLERRNYIVKLLHEWQLINNVDPQILSQEFSQDIVKQIKVLPYNMKQEWTLVPKYTIGR